MTLSLLDSTNPNFLITHLVKRKGESRDEIFQKSFPIHMDEQYQPTSLYICLFVRSGPLNLVNQDRAHMTSGCTGSKQKHGVTSNLFVPGWPFPSEHLEYNHGNGLEKTLNSVHQAIPIATQVVH